jgi:hypothetical protein
LGRQLREIGFISADDDSVFQRAVNLTFLPQQPGDKQALD